MLGYCRWTKFQEVICCSMCTVVVASISYISELKSLQPCFEACRAANDMRNSKRMKARYVENVYVYTNYVYTYTYIYIHTYQYVCIHLPMSRPGNFQHHVEVPWRFIRAQLC